MEVSDFNLIQNLDTEKVSFILSESNLRKSSPDSLAEIINYARYLSESGLELLSNKLINEVTIICFENLTEQPCEYLEIICNSISLLIENFEYEQSLIYIEIAKQNLGLYPCSSEKVFKLRLETLYFILNIKENKGDVEKLEEYFLAVLSLKSYLSDFKFYHYQYNVFLIRLFYLNYDKEKLINEINNELDIAGNYFWFDMSMLKVRALQELGRLKDAFNLLGNIPIESNRINLKQKIQLIIMRNRLCVKSISFHQDLLIKTCPILTYQSRSEGNRFKYYKTVENILRIRENEWRGFHIDDDCCCWEIENSKINLSKYEEIKSDGEVLDLRAGILLKDGNMDLLTKLRAKVLMCVIAYSYLGASDLEIADYVFNDQNILIFSATKRIQDIVTQLQKNSFPLYRKNGRVYFDVSQINYKIIIPRDHQYLGELAYLKKYLKKFSAANLRELFAIKRSTSWSYINNWLADGKIVKSQERGFYLINS